MVGATGTRGEPRTRAARDPPVLFTGPVRERDTVNPHTQPPRDQSCSLCLLHLSASPCTHLGSLGATRHGFVGKCPCVSRVRFASSPRAAPGCRGLPVTTPACSLSRAPTGWAEVKRAEPRGRVRRGRLDSVPPRPRRRSGATPRGHDARARVGGGSCVCGGVFRRLLDAPGQPVRVVCGRVDTWRKWQGDQRGVVGGGDQTNTQRCREGGGTADRETNWGGRGEGQQTGRWNKAKE